MEFDYKSFILGVQVGRRIRLWDAARKVPPLLEQAHVITEDGDPIVTEIGDYLVTEQYFTSEVSD